MKGLDYYTVTVERNATTRAVLTDVPEYELRVLQAIHDGVDGEGNAIEMVRIQEHTQKELPDDFSPLEAFQSLKRKYGDKNSGPILSQVYPNARELERSLHYIDMPDEIEGEPRKRGRPAKAA